MTRTFRDVFQDALSVSVDECRIRVQTGEQITFVDARKAEDWAAARQKIAGAIRVLPGEGVVRPPCHKQNYIVV